jgi:lipoyl(octanoyl) transferase
MFQKKISKDLIDYQEACDFMENKVGEIYEGKAGDLIWALEHPEIYTKGTSAKDSDLIDKDKFPIFKTGRGGEFTYHGPGQRIYYMMLNLKNYYRPPDLKKFVHDLEQLVIDSLAEFEIESFRRDGRVGIWCYDKNGMENKISAIGIRVRKWISFHGISVNISPNLDNFSGIVPCGISEFGVTSLQELKEQKIKLEEFDKVFFNKAEQLFK